MSEQKATMPSEHEAKQGLAHEIIGLVDKIMRTNPNTAAIRWNRLTEAEDYENESDPEKRAMHELGRGLVDSVMAKYRPAPEATEEVKNYNSVEFLLSDGLTDDGMKVTYMAVNLDLDSHRTCRFAQVIREEELVYDISMVYVDADGPVTSVRRITPKEDKVRDTLYQTIAPEQMVRAGRIAEGVAPEAEVQDTLIELRGTWLKTMDEEEVRHLTEKVLDLHYRAKATLDLQRKTSDLPFQGMLEVRDFLTKQQ